MSCDDLAQHALLRARRFERQYARTASRTRSLTSMTVPLGDCSRPCRRTPIASPSQKNSSKISRRCAGDWNCCRFRAARRRRESGPGAARPPARSGVSREQFLRDDLFDLRKVEPLDYVMHDGAKLFSAHFAELAIDRHAAARVNRVRRIVVVRDEFVVGIFDFEKSAPPALPLAVEQARAALAETSFAGKPDSTSRRVSGPSHRRPKTRRCAASRPSPAYVPATRTSTSIVAYISVFEVAHVREVRAVFVAHGQVVEQVFDSDLKRVRPSMRRRRPRRVSARS